MKPRKRKGRRCEVPQWGIVLGAAGAHLAQGASLVLDASSLGATSISGLASLGHVGAGFLMVVVGLAALVHTVMPRKMLGLLLLVPQQVLLFVTGASCFAAVMRSAYADGVPRPHGFIFTDQIAWVSIAVVHTIMVALMAADQVTRRYDDE